MFVEVDGEVFVHDIGKYMKRKNITGNVLFFCYSYHNENDIHKKNTSKNSNYSLMKRTLSICKIMQTQYILYYEFVKFHHFRMIVKSYKKCSIFLFIACDKYVNFTKKKLQQIPLKIQTENIY